MLYLITSLLFLSSFNLDNVTSSFDNALYFEDAATSEMLNNHFVMDINNSDLNAQLDSYLENHFDEINHISGHFYQDGEMYYYTVYGEKENVKKVELLEVSQELFKQSKYYKTTKSLKLDGLCRTGNGFPHPRMCPVGCANYTNLCLGIVCPPSFCK